MLLTRRMIATCAVRAIGVFFSFVSFTDVEYARAQAVRGNPVSFRWRVPNTYHQTVEDSLVFDGTIEQEQGTKGLPLVAVFVGVALLPSLVDAILTLRNKLVEPGLKIDTRGSDIKIDVDSTLPHGTILLVDNTGAKLYMPNQLTDPAELARALLGTKEK